MNRKERRKLRKDKDLVKELYSIIIKKDMALKEKKDDKKILYL